MSTKQDKITSFNPNNAGLTDSQIFGLPFNEEESDLVEVAPGEDDWNGNVDARLLYHMCGVALGA